MRRDELTGESASGELPTAGHLKGVRVNSRREAIYVALAAAEVCWAAPVFLALTRERIGLAPAPHSPLLLWLGLLALLLGFFYLYRALAAANLSLRLQQSLLVAGLLLSIGLVLRFHVYADAGLRGIDWFLQPLRSFATLTWAVPVEFIAILTLTHLWARGTHLARRSLGAGSVGFSFRSGVVILMGTALIISVFTGEDISGFVVPYFFFALVALALARSRLAPATVLFMGWFGPRGLASIVLGLFFLEQEARLPGQPLIEIAITASVLLSIFAHGMTAAPFTKLYARRVETMDAGVPELAAATGVVA